MYHNTINEVAVTEPCSGCSPQSAAAAPSPVMGNMPPSEGMPGGPMPPGFFQVGDIQLCFRHLLLVHKDFYN